LCVHTHTCVYIHITHSRYPILYSYTRFLDSYLNRISTARKCGSVYTVISANKYKQLTDEPVADFYVNFIFTPKLCQHPSVFSVTVYFLYYTSTLHYSHICDSLFYSMIKPTIYIFTYFIHIYTRFPP
jgi:hypothetical protein